MRFGCDDAAGVGASLLAKILREQARSYLEIHNRQQAGSYRACIIAPFSASDNDKTMEAEQLNSLANQLQGLATRSAELRRYL
jgi:hypothetical protein